MLFNKKIEPSCAYCRRGRAVDAETVLCPKRGVCTPEGACRSFRYDPLKRVPKRAAVPDFSRFDDEDFSL